MCVTLLSWKTTSCPVLTPQRPILNCTEIVSAGASAYPAVNGQWTSTGVCLREE